MPTKRPQFDIGLQVVIDSQGTRRSKLDAALRYLVTYLDESMMPDPIDIDPAFAIQSIAQSLQPHVEILVRLLGDALLEVPPVRKGILSKEQAAEMFLRLAYSHYLIPHRDTDALLATVHDFAGLTPRSVRVSVS